MVSPVQLQIFPAPTCISNQEDVGKNSRLLLGLTLQIKKYIAELEEITNKINFTPDATVTLFFSGNIKAYFWQISTNHLGVLIVSNLIWSLWSAITLILFMKDRCCFTPENRQYFHRNYLTPMMQFCCYKESQRMMQVHSDQQITPAQGQRMAVTYQPPTRMDRTDNPIALTYAN